MVSISATTITFDKICDQLHITEIDFLQIDTEGFDFEIIKMIDFDKYKIKKIRFEKWLFDPKEYTRYHNNIANQLGTNGYNLIIDKLKKYNYQISEINDSDGNDILAILP